MILVDRFGPVPEAARGGCIALGNLDGFHRGHAAVLDAAHRTAAGGPWGAAVFEPPPRRFFQPDAPPFRLMSPSLRREAAAARGLDLLAEIPFDATIAAMSPADFCHRVLSHWLAVRHVVIGFDFRFGKDRAGDGAVLRAQGEALGFGVTVLDEIACDDGAKISSSRIRAALEAGRLDEANDLLGAPWRVDGVIEKGDQRGRTIGFPTANLRLDDQLHPCFGVYAVTADLGDGVLRPGVANFGRTPTVGARAPLLEVNLFDFSGDLYGQRIIVAFHAFLRPEQKFDSLEALKAQIAADAEAALLYHSA